MHAIWNSQVPWLKKLAAFDLPDGVRSTELSHQSWISISQSFVCEPTRIFGIGSH